MTPRRTAEERIANRFAEAPAKRLWGGRKRDLNRECWHGFVDWLLSRSDPSLDLRLG
jgi:hypothetical protein